MASVSLSGGVLAWGPNPSGGHLRVYHATSMRSTVRQAMEGMGARSGLRRLVRFDAVREALTQERRDGIENVMVELVMHPATVLTRAHDAGIAQCRHVM